MILVDSIYIHESGGKVLLDYFINTIIKRNLSNRFYFLLDARGDYDFLDSIKFELGESSELKRFNFYRKNKYTFSKVFCFGNVPPPIKYTIPVYTYFHNILLAKSIRGYPLRPQVLMVIKRCYIRLVAKNTDFFFVQSRYVQKIVNDKISINKTICIIPFYKLNKKPPRVNLNVISFAFVSNANPHKNHKNLLLAWEELSKQGLYPILHLTVEEYYVTVISNIKRLQTKGLKIYNHGFIDSSVLYAQSNYLIYPSLAESFGLSLVEAVDAGLNVIASDLPYVNEVITSSYKFDPYNVIAIVETVKKVLSTKKVPNSSITVENKIDELILKIME